MQWPFIKYVPKQTNFKFVRFATIAAAFSVIAVIGSLVSLFTLGLNLGIDFKGGTLVEAKWDQPIDLAAVRGSLEAMNLQDVQVQDFGAPNDAMIRFLPPEGQDAPKVVDAVKAELRTLMPGVEFPRVEVVGAKVSGELYRDGVLALAVAVALMLVYIWFRFEIQMGFGSVLALFHDVILTLGFLSITQLEFSLTSIAALLTIIGYSMNDTVVVFDRIRENMRKYKKMSMADIIDLSTNETLSRTIMTGLTGLLALLSLTVIGGATIQAFTIAMIFGVIIGTYSSIYVAAPVILLWRPKREDEKAAAKAAEPARP